MAKIYKHISKPLHSRPAREELGIAPGEAITAAILESTVLTSGLTKRMNTLVGSLIEEEGLWDIALEMAMSDNDQTAFRVSWGLEWAYNLRPVEIEGRFDIFLRYFLAASNPSVLRVYSKMLCDMMRRGTAVLSDAEAAQVAEKSFDLLINPDTAVAIKGWQIELLTDLIPRIDWIEENLTEVVRQISEDPECTPGMAAGARHYFRRIAKMRK